MTIVTFRHARLFVALALILITNPCFAASQDEAADQPIQLVYGYRNIESFMQQHLQDHLRTVGFNVRIDYDQSLRQHSHSWLTNPELFRLYAASGDCSVHALSLPGASSWSLHRYGGKELFRPLLQNDLETYAPSYFARVQQEKEGHYLHRPDRSGPWYALTGYRYHSERNVYHLVTTDNGISALSLPTDRELLSNSPALPSLTLYHSGSVTLDDLHDALTVTANLTRQPPLLAWDDFESSFAPLYAAFGIGTVGSNLTRPSSITQPSIIAGVPAQISPLFREFLQTIINWYSSELIEPEFPRLTRTDAARLAEEREYSFVSFPYSDALISPSSVFASVVRRSERAAVLQVTRNGDTTWSLRRSPFVYAEAYPSCVDEEQIAPLLLLFEYTRSPGYSGWKERVFGLENQHYRVLQGMIKPHPVTTVTPPLPDYWHDNEYALWHFKRLPEITLDYEYEAMYLRALRASAYAADSGGPPTLVDIPFAGTPFRSSHDPASLFSALQDYAASDPATDLQRLSSTVSQLTREYVFRWITGQSSIESEWDDYVDEWTDAGGTVLLRAIDRPPGSD